MCKTGRISKLAAALLAAGALAVPAQASAKIDALDPHVPGSAVTAADAIAADPTQVTGASLPEFAYEAGGPAASPLGVGDKSQEPGPTVLTGFPTQGNTYAILTNGEVNTIASLFESEDFGSTEYLNQQEAPGVERGPASHDWTVLKVDVNVPGGDNCLGADFRFLSEEYPDYVGSEFNDAFIAETDSSSWRVEEGGELIRPNDFAASPGGVAISVNGAGATEMYPEEAEGTYFNAATELITTKTPITPGAHSIYFSIFDASDHVLDSAVFIDNLRFFNEGPGACKPPIAGATLEGEVKNPAEEPVPSAPVEICPVVESLTPCKTRFSDSSGVYEIINLPEGEYEVTARSAAGGPEYADGHAGPVAVSGTETFTQNVMLGPPLSGPPPGTTITNVGESAGGVPTLFWTEASTITTEGCAGGTASYTVTVGGKEAQNGTLSESPAGSGHYEGTIQPLLPSHGNGKVKIEVSGCAEPSTVEFAIYIDPSGVVKDANTGDPIPGATVTLFRSDELEGPFTQVTDGSAVMSPANRSNPDTTDASGRFGWDVVAGYYKVEASAAGCTSATSSELAIPPPVTNLELLLECASSSSGAVSGGGAGSSGAVSGGGGGIEHGTAVAKKIALVKRGKALLKLTCHGGGACHGALKLVARVEVGKRKGARHSKKRVHNLVIGKARYSIPVGRTKTIRVPLTSKGKGLLRKSGKRGLRVELRGSGVTNRTVWLRKAKKHRRSRTSSLQRASFQRVRRQQERLQWVRLHEAMQQRGVLAPRTGGGSTHR